MKEFSSDDYFYRGFIYGTRLSNSGLMPGVKGYFPEGTLRQSIANLKRMREALDDMIDELSLKHKKEKENDKRKTLCHFFTFKG